jgi:5'-nucleotidase
MCLASHATSLVRCFGYDAAVAGRTTALRVLVSNDDGVDAPGIRILAQGLRDAGHSVTVVAPDRDRSGASNSLTLDGPVRVVEMEDGPASIKPASIKRFRVYGTPTDCVHVAITGMLETEPDIVVSGINTTANMGDDVIYSGTVAAAMEGRFLGLPAVAVSLAARDHDGRHYETAARAAVEIIARLAVDPLPADTILNVNVPDLAWSDVKGFEVTRLGNRHRAESCIPQRDPRGRTWWWIGAAGPEQDAGAGTDFHAVRTGHISITPIHVDLTRFQALEQVASWVGGLASSLQERSA